MEMDYDDDDVDDDIAAAADDDYDGGGQLLRASTVRSSTYLREITLALHMKCVYGIHRWVFVALLGL